jgi:hypothetical protein
MPVISMFYRIIVLMYYFDNRRHKQHIFMFNIAMRKQSFRFPMAKLLKVSYARQSLSLYTRGSNYIEMN